MNSGKTKPIRLGLISLGCAKNLVDGEIMLGALLKAGVEITNDPSGADAIIVNTCSFIGDAQQESVDSILETAAHRSTHNPAQALIVSGCLPQRYREELPKLLPEVDAFMGIDQVAEAPRIIREAMARRASTLADETPLHGAEGKGRTAPKPKIHRTRKRLAAALGDQSHSHALGHPARDPENRAPLVEVHARPTFIPDYATPRFRLTPRHFAYLKIAEGCNHPCTFCIIPRMRGAHRSRPMDDILREARQLISEGVRELNLISQDSTYYGLDRRPVRGGSIAAPENFTAAARALPEDVPTLCTLLRALNELDGKFWIRLLYTHPAHWTDELIRTIAECPKVARYVDMPLQHIHPNLLQRMRRETSREYIVDLIARIRAGVPGIALRTTFIVGFPGETEASFETLLDFIRDTQFERLGVFTYSHEEGTLAGKMAQQVAERTKKSRQRRAMAAQQKVAREVARAMAGQLMEVLVERRAGPEDLSPARIRSWEHGLIRNGKTAAPPAHDYWVARSQADAPDIDGRVFVKGLAETEGFQRVRIIGHSDYDLYAEPATAS